MARSAAATVLCMGFLAAEQSLAQQPASEDTDLNRLPQAAASNAPSPASAARSSNRRLVLEDALTGWDNQTLDVPTPASQPSWQNRLSLDADMKFATASTLTWGFSDRLTLYAGDTIPSVTSANLENDLREAYFADEFLPRAYLDLGRLNLKEGIAYGFSPTDFFKPRTAVALSSIDPAVARENRLGVAMVEAQWLFDGASLSAAFAPSFSHKSSIPTSAPASFDPQWGRTNADNRGLVAASFTGYGFNPQLLLFFDGQGTNAGFSVSHVMGASTVGYLEWAGVKERALAARAIAFGVDTGALPSGLVRVDPNPAKHFSNDVSAGAAWTSSFNLTLNVEYHYHESGASNAEFAHAFVQGRSSPRGASLFWYIRQYASDQQEPLTSREVFLRADWQDVIPSTLNLGAVVFVAQRDGSALAQLYAQYFVSRTWTASAYLGSTIGSTSSVFGSIPWRVSAVAQIVRYF